MQKITSKRAYNGHCKCTFGVYYHCDSCYDCSDCYCYGICDSVDVGGVGGVGDVVVDQCEMDWCLRLCLYLLHNVQVADRALAMDYFHRQQQQQQHCY